MADDTTYKAYQASLLIPGASGPNGKAWKESFGSVKDDRVALLKSATKASFPTYAGPDGLARLGAEIQIDRGPLDTDAVYAERLRAAWTTWGFAGSAYSVLKGLEVQGYTSMNGNPTIVQQNGLAHSLNGTNQSDGSDLVIDLLGPNPAIGGNYPLAPGVTEWWMFDATSLDANSDQWNNRFAVIFPGLPAGWNNIQDPPTDLTAPTLAEVNNLRRIVNKWRAGKALFMGFWVLVSGVMWGFPPNLVWGGGGLVWGGTMVHWQADEQ